MFKKNKKKTAGNKALTQTHPPKAPTQKAQQGVSIRKCTRSAKSEKKPEEK